MTCRTGRRRKQPECHRIEIGRGFQVEHYDDGGTAIVCERCGMRSSDPDDVIRHYCGLCNVFHED